MNNRYNSGTTPLRLSASLSYDNFFQRGDTGTLTYEVAPDSVRDAEVTSASYLFHIPYQTLSLLFSYLHSNSNVTTLGKHRCQRPWHERRFPPAGAAGLDGELQAFVQHGLGLQALLRAGHVRRDEAGPRRRRSPITR